MKIDNFEIILIFLFVLCLGLIALVNWGVV